MVTVPAAKLQPPVRRADTLVRTRLIDALQSHIDHKLQILVAPAGFGKSTLLLDFLHEAATPFCWATLDGADADVTGFLDTLVASLRRRFPEIGARTLAAVQGGRDLERRASAIARVLAAEIEERIDTFLLLVLDDFHEVNGSAPVTRFLDELLRVLPDHLRIVLAGRALPNLTVSRLIVEGQLFGLGEADLRFTAGELQTLLGRRGAPLISPEEASALAEGAEGWIAGFLLSVPGLREGLAGGLIGARGDGPLYDYLAAEAFDRQPEDLQDFLLASAVPETPDADTCDLLCDCDAQSMLDRAESAGLFVTRLRSGRGAFCYHQLFRAFLQTRLRRTRPREYTRLHTLLAEHLEGRGAWESALVHLREAGEHDRAAALVARIAPPLEAAGRWRALAAAVESLSPESAARHPQALIAGARAALMAGDLPRAESLARAAREVGTTAGDRVIEAWGLASIGNVRRLQGRTRDALSVLRQAIELAPGEGELVASARRDLGQCLGVQGDFAGAAAELRQALGFFDDAGAEYDAARAEMGLGVALVKTGRIAEAIARYESALERWRRLEDTGMEAEMLNCLGCAYSYRGDFARARETLRDGLERAHAGGYPRTEGAIRHSLGEVLLAAGEVAEARRAFEQGLAAAQDTGELWQVAQIYDALALTAAFEGDLVQAEEHAHHAIALAERQDSRFQSATFSLTLGAIQARLGRRGALDTLRTAAAALEQMGAPRELLRGQLWLAQVHHAAGAMAAARHHLHIALRLAADLGSDGGLDLHARWDPALFEAARAEGIEPHRLAAVLERVATRLPAAPTAPAVLLPGFVARAFGPGVLMRDDGVEVEWKWDKSRELFFFLLHTGARHVEQALASLWPDLSAAKARAQLHTAVYRLRRNVHPQLILLRAGVYRVNDELVTFYDVREFDRLLRAAAAATGDEAAALLAEAVDLRPAPFFDHDLSEWSAIERDRLEHRYLAALGQLSDAYAAGGRPRESIAAAERLLAADPLREDAHARIIRGFLRVGDRAAAQRQLTRCLDMLAGDLGVEPSPELRALERRIR